MLLLPVIIVLAGATCAHASGVGTVKSRTTYSLKDSHPVPASWKLRSRASVDETVAVQIGLEHASFDELERQLYEISDPDHHRYGQHLNVDQVNELMKPKQESMELVLEWLRDHDIPTENVDLSPAGDWIMFAVPIKQLEDLLNNQYSVYEHDDGTAAVRSERWSLPAHLHEHIAVIHPTNWFFHPESSMRSSPPIPSPRQASIRSSLASRQNTNDEPHTSDPGVAAACDSKYMTPDCLRAFYGTANYTIRAADKNSMAINSFLSDPANRSDATLFLQKYRNEAVSGAADFSQESVNGGIITQTPNTRAQLKRRVGQECALDVQTLLGISWPTPLTVYETGGLVPNLPDPYTNFWGLRMADPFVPWLQYLLAQPSLPNVISVSWGDSESSIPYPTAIRICQMFAQLGARGTSVFFASGDVGVGPPGGCTWKNGTQDFPRAFPASCPYVTSVGGTKGLDPEVAAYDASKERLKVFPVPFTSGGGFSRYFPRPQYQDAAVPGYLSNVVKDQHKGNFNPEGRGIPDISAQAQHFPTIWNGTFQPQDGTSASTPVVAGIFALVNDALISAGRAPMGFINPWLYKNGHKFLNDILEGSSDGCNTDGFPAAKGWDAVTGLGTPYFPKILESLGLDQDAPPPTNEGEKAGPRKWLLASLTALTMALLVSF